MSKIKKIRFPSSLELQFETLWVRFGNGMIPRKEYMFASPRRWRFDFAWPEHMVAIELEGGIWTDGAHTRGQHYRSDAEKYREATKLGWRVMRYVTNDLRENPFKITAEIKQLLEVKRASGS